MRVRGGSRALTVAICLIAIKKKLDHRQKVRRAMCSIFSTNKNNNKNEETFKASLN